MLLLALNRNSFLWEITAVSFFLVIFRRRNRGPILSGFLKISSAPSYSMQDTEDERFLLEVVLLMTSSVPLVFLLPEVLMATAEKWIKNLRIQMLYISTLT